jgi:hypothetical protein
MNNQQGNSFVSHDRGTSNGRKIAGFGGIEMRQPISEIRRNNMRLLIERIGMELFVKQTGKSRQQLHQYVGRKPIRNVGDKMAREIEQAFRLPGQWLDDPQMSSALSDLIEAAEILQGVSFDALMRRLDRLEEFIARKLLDVSAPRKQNDSLDDAEGSSAHHQTKKRKRGDKSDGSNPKSLGVRRD